MSGGPARCGGAVTLREARRRGCDLAGASAEPRRIPSCVASRTRNAVFLAGCEGDALRAGGITHRVREILRTTRNALPALGHSACRLRRADECPFAGRLQQLRRCERPARCRARVRDLNPVLQRNGLVAHDILWPRPRELQASVSCHKVCRRHVGHSLVLSPISHVGQGFSPAKSRSQAGLKACPT